MLFVLVYEKVRFMKKTPFPFFVLYFLVYMLNVIYSTFFPVYLDGLDIPSEQIGILLSIGPFINIFAQPFWGIASDRAKYKNTAVMVMFVFSALTVLLFPVKLLIPVHPRRICSFHRLARFRPCPQGPFCTSLFSTLRFDF
jgi:MFS family permease